MFKTLSEVDKLNELHWNFITQDFLLFIVRDIMKKETLQQKYENFISAFDFENDNWYIRLKKYTEISQILKSKSKENKYNNYEELNQDFKSLCQDESEDFLQRYLFESDNGFSKIKQQLIELTDRDKIRQLIDNDYFLLHNILINDNKREVYSSISNIVNSNKYAVLFRFTRALFPNDFTSVDSKNYFNLLLKKLREEYDFGFEGNDRFINNEIIIELIEFDDIYKAQIFFWHYISQTNDFENYSEDEVNEEESNYETTKNSMKNIHPLNQILFGAPGYRKNT